MKGGDEISEKKPLTQVPGKILLVKRKKILLGLSYQ